MQTTFNVIISGVSVSGNIDTNAMPIRIGMGNSDRIGYATFALQNKDLTYSDMNISGPPPVEISIGGITLFRGTIERADNVISVDAGLVTVAQCYDYGQELMGIVSPDARQISLLQTNGQISLTSGDQGIQAREGVDLASLVSGVNFSSGATVASFMRQFFGIETDPSGSFSGTAFSFKPHISGYTWDTWYKPDGSPDNNVNFWIPIGTLKVRREFAWDVLRRITRQAIAIDSAGNRVAFETYVGVSGDIHLFTSGSSEPFIASGVVMQYYQNGTSGSDLNNIIAGTVPYDSTTLKNYLLGWFPVWARFPLDMDEFSDFFAYSGARWSGLNIDGATVLSGDAASTTIGLISVRGMVGATGTSIGMTYNHPTSFNIERFSRLSGRLNTAGGKVDIVYQIKQEAPGLGIGIRQIQIIDTSGNFIIKSGGQDEPFPGPATALFMPSKSGWHLLSDTIYRADGVFSSGTGRDGGWASVGGPDLTRVKQIVFGMDMIGAPSLGSGRTISVDNIRFEFAYQFSPIIGFNSGSQFLYGRRYALMEYPFMVTDDMASGIMTHELESQMGAKQYAEFTIKDNPKSRTAVQLSIKPGQVVRIDAPALNTGSGQTFNFWRLIDVSHDFSTAEGFRSQIRVIPWFSGTITTPNSNLINYILPYDKALKQPTRRMNQLPANWPFLQLN